MNNFYDEAEKILKRLDEQVALIVAKLKIGSKSAPEDVFFDNQDFMLLMNIIKNTISFNSSHNFLFNFGL